MMRRNILGPVIMCFLVIGLIGTSIGQTAQAKTHKADSKLAAVKEAKHHKHAADTAPAAKKAKKNSALKKKSKAKLAAGSEHKDKKKLSDARKAKAHKNSTLKAAGRGKSKADRNKLKVAERRKPKAVGKKLKVAGHGKPRSEGARHKVAKARHDRKARTYAHHGERTHSREASRARSHESGTPKVKAVQALPVPDYQIHTPKPSDYYLSKTDPDPINGAGGDLKTEKRTPLKAKVLELAYRCLGVPYRPGGTTTNGFDCSGFVKYVFKENGIVLGRSSREQALDGKQVSLSEIRPGDLIFFRMHQRRRDPARIDHVGLYVGNGQFIHAASSPHSREIKVDNLESSHFLPRVVGARRVLDDDDPDSEESLPN